MPSQGMESKCFPFALLLSVLLMAYVSSAVADVERYKSESEYVARLVELGYSVLLEDFEGSAFDHVRSTNLTQHVALSIAARQVTWSSASHELWNYVPTTYITTNPNWARGPGWGIYDTELASTIEIATPAPIYGIGLWVNTNPDFQDVGFLFRGRSTANEPGYVLTGYGAMYPGDNPGAGHTFIGLVDTNGFTNVVVTGTLEVNEENQLEGATVFGADDFILATDLDFLVDPHEYWRASHFAVTDLVSKVRETTVWGDTADPDGDKVSNFAEYVFGGDPNIADRESMLLTVTTYTTGTVAQLEFTYPRRTNDAALAFGPRISSDLSSWYSGSNYVYESARTVQGNHIERVTCRARNMPDPGKAFAQVVVTVPPP